MSSWIKPWLGAVALGLLSLSAYAQMAGHEAGHGAMHQHHGHATASAPDTRILVNYPPELRQHTLSSMRAHLQSLHSMQEALAAGDFQQAAHVAESTLGMSALHDHRASDNAQFMPAAMARMGSAMHQAASQFAIAAQDASATGDLKKPLQALAKVSGTCVACHAAYKLQ
jgi:hypothetical protein